MELQSVPPNYIKMSDSTRESLDKKSQVVIGWPKRLLRFLIMKNEITIPDRIIGPGQTPFIIAEMSGSHIGHGTEIGSPAHLAPKSQYQEIVMLANVAFSAG